MFLSLFLNTRCYCLLIEAHILGNDLIVFFLIFYVMDNPFNEKDEREQSVCMMVSIDGIECLLSSKP